MEDNTGQARRPDEQDPEKNIDQVRRPDGQADDETPSAFGADDEAPSAFGADDETPSAFGADDEASSAFSAEENEVSAAPIVTSWQTSSTQGEGLAGSPFGFDEAGEGAEEEPPRAKPFLSRLLNRIGIRTGAGVDWMLDWIQVLAVAALLAWLTMSYVVVRMRVPTGSMEPTIRTDSSFFVDKLSFYLRHPTPGDIIVFWHTEGSGNRVRYVKRLIATGGQKVKIIDCIKFSSEECGVYINGQKLQDEAFNRAYYTGGKMGEQEWEVPKDHYFVLGDNSRNSLDSRFWGYVDKNDFIGEPFLRVWPLYQFGFMNGYFGSAH